MIHIEYCSVCIVICIVLLDMNDSESYCKHIDTHNFFCVRVLQVMLPSIDLSFCNWESVVTLSVTGIQWDLCKVGLYSSSTWVLYLYVTGSACRSVILRNSIDSHLAWFRCPYSPTVTFSLLVNKQSSWDLDQYIIYCLVNV